MTSIAVDMISSQVKDSLSIKAGIGAEAQAEAEGLIPKMAGRQLSHWSQYVVGAGAVVGLVTTIAAAILGKTVIAIGCGVLFFTNVVASYYIKEFMPMRTLGAYVGILATKVKEMGNHILKLEKANTDLEAINKGFDKNTKDYQAVMLEGETKLTQRTQELTVVTDRLRETAAKLEQVKGLYEKLKGAAATITDRVLAFNDSTLKYHKDVDTLKQQAAAVASVHNQLGVEVAAVDKASQEYAQQNKDLEAMVGKLDLQTQLMQKLYNQISEERRLLEEKVAALEKINASVVTTANTVHDTGHRIESTVDRLNERIDQAHQMEELNKAAPLLGPLLERLKREKAAADAKAKATAR